MAEKILIADDDLETLRLVGLMLQRQGYEIIAANNGAQALSQAKNEKPDLIIVDVMMPDMDGYQVTRRLRQEAVTANTPILMFTAKSLVDDKVAGYEAGADDYLTKPVHPAELVAHIKSLLGRTRGRPTAQVEQGKIMAVIAPKGGLGSSSVTLNLAISMAQQMKADVIAAEMRPGQGAFGQMLGYSNPGGVKTLLQKKVNEITISEVEKELIRSQFGIRLLMASTDLRDIELVNSTLQFEAVLTVLQMLSPLVLLDIGNPILPNYAQVLNLCSEVIVLTEPYPNTVQHTKLLLNSIAELGFGKTKLLHLVVINRIRADIQLTVTQVQEALGHKVAQVIPPAPEQAYHAAMKNVPLTQIQPDGLVAQQFARLAEAIGPVKTKRNE